MHLSILPIILPHALQCIKAWETVVCCLGECASCMPEARLTQEWRIMTWNRCSNNKGALPLGSDTIPSQGSHDAPYAISHEPLGPFQSVGDKFYVWPMPVMLPHCHCWSKTQLCYMLGCVCVMLGCLWRQFANSSCCRIQHPGCTLGQGDLNTYHQIFFIDFHFFSKLITN